MNRKPWKAAMVCGTREAVFTRSFAAAAAVLTLVFLAGCQAASPRLRPVQTTAEYPCFRALAPIVVDGKLDESAWQSAPTQLFGDISTGDPRTYRVTCRMLWDDDYLYLGYDVADPNVWYDCTERDGVMHERKPYNESFVKVFIDPDTDARKYIEIHISPGNNIRDLYFDIPTCCRHACEIFGIEYPKDRKAIKACAHPEWDLDGMKSKIVVRGTPNDSSDVDDGWTLELALPFAGLKPFTGAKPSPPLPGDLWWIHLARRRVPAGRKDKPSYWTWPTVGVVNCHELQTWGVLRFIGENGMRVGIARERK